MTPVMPLFSPMMPYGSGLTPQPVTNTNSLSILEEQQRLQQQQQAQQANTGESAQRAALYYNPQPIKPHMLHHYSLFEVERLAASIRCMYRDIDIGMLFNSTEV